MLKQPIYDYDKMLFQPIYAYNDIINSTRKGDKEMNTKIQELSVLIKTVTPSLLRIMEIVDTESYFTSADDVVQIAPILNHIHEFKRHGWKTDTSSRVNAMVTTFAKRLSEHQARLLNVQLEEYAAKLREQGFAVDESSSYPEE